MLGAAKSENLELRDTAVRALGNFVQNISPEDLPVEYKGIMLEAIQGNLSDSSAGVRSKAIRSYGKLARYGAFDSGQRYVFVKRPVCYHNACGVCRGMAREAFQFECIVE